MMYDPRSREQLWKEYYKAMHRGDKAAAQRIIKALHTPPTGGQRLDARAGNGCSRCRRNF